MKDLGEELVKKLAIICFIIIIMLLSCQNMTVRNKLYVLPTDEIKSEINETYDCTVQIYIYNGYLGGWGSGCIVSEDGLILTARHVVEDANSLEVYKADGTTYEASVVYIDEYEDFAFIDINGTHDYETFGDYNSVEVGDVVYIIGTPLDSGLFNTTIYGSVSGLKRKQPFFSYEDVLQVDSGIISGFSGGPVCNLDGEIIGIAVGYYFGSTVGICIPITNILKVYATLSTFYESDA